MADGSKHTKDTKDTPGHGSADALERLARLEEAYSQSDPPAPQIEEPEDVFTARADEDCDLQSALHLLLEQLDWPANERQQAENVPASSELSTILDIRSALSKLGYDTPPQLMDLAELDESDLPCLVQYRGVVYVLTEKVSGGLKAFNSKSAEFEHLLSDIRRQVFIPQIATGTAETQQLEGTPWTSVLVRKFRALIAKMFAITLFINLAALAVPLFVMTVYDKAIGTRSDETLKYLIIGIGIILVTELGLRTIRGRALAYLGTRFEVLTSSRAFQRLMFLPLQAVEDAPLSAQLTRLRQFENVREFFSGSMAHAVLDLPFLLMFLAAIALVGGPLFLVPVGLICAFGILALVFIPMNRRRLALTGQSRQEIQAFHLETVQKHRAIKETRAEGTWLERYENMIGRSAARHFRSEQLNLFVMTITQALIAMGAALTLYVGALRVIEGLMSVGALIATMALVWRAMSPLQASFLSLSRISQVSHAFRQINHLMAAELERQPGQLPVLARSYEGNILIKRLNFRFGQSPEPSLAGINLRIGKGERVALTGPSGGGKSVLLKMIAGLYKSRSGAVLIDGVDLRHADPAEYRHVVGYAGEIFDFVEGTIEENLLLANPLATDLQLRKAWEDAGLNACAGVFPDGLKSGFTKAELVRLNASVRQRLLLARAYVKEAVVILLDRPETGLDPSGMKALKRKLNRLHEKVTVILVTNDVGLLRSADKIAYMQDGGIVLEGPPDEVISTVLKAA